MRTPLRRAWNRGPDRDELNDRATALRETADLTGDVDTAEEAVALARRAAAPGPTAPTELDRADYLGNLAMALLTRYEVTADASDLDEATEVVREALAEPGDAEQARLRTNLAAVLSSRFRVTGAVDDAIEAVEAARSAVTSTEKDHPSRAGRLENLAAALIQFVEHCGDRARLGEALEVAAESVAATADDDPGLPTRIGKVATVLALRFEYTGDEDAIDQAVALQRRAVTMAGDAHPHAGVLLLDLAGLLSLRHTHFGGEADLADAVAGSRLAVAAVPDGDPLRPTALHNLSSAVLDAYEDSLDPALLDEAIAAGEEATRLLDDGHADRPAIDTGLGNALLVRFEHLRDDDDLRRATALFAEALRRTPRDHPYWPGRLSNHARATLLRYQRDGDLTDLHRALADLGHALAATPDDSPDQPDRLNALASAHRERARVLGALDDIEAAVKLSEREYAALAGGHPRRPECLEGLSRGLLLRFGRTADPADLTRAVELAEESVRLSRRGSALRELANALLTRVEVTGSASAADRAVTLAEEAEALVPADHPDVVGRAHALADLAIALTARAERTGSGADLDRAIDLARTVTRLLPPDHAERPQRLVNLAYALLLRIDGATEDDLDELDEVVAVAAEATALLPAAHPDWWMAATCNGNALLARFEITKRRSDLSAAITAYRSVLARVGTPDRAGALANLGQALAADGRLDEACALLREAVARASADHPDRAKSLLGLGQALRERPDGRAEAIGFFRQAVASAVGLPSVRLAAAHAWGTTAADAGDWAEATSGFAAAVGLLPLVAWHGLDRRDLDRLLASWPGLARDAAACAVRAGRPELAVELLEQGRSVIWNQTLRLRTDLEDLAAEHPALAARLEAARRILDAPAKAAGPRQRAALDWDETLAQVRRLPGFTRFLEPMALAELLPAASTVIVNVSRYGCAALAITDDGVRPIALKATWEDLFHHGDAYLKAVQRLGGVGDEPLTLTRYLAYSTDVWTTLGWLWDAIAEPVLTTLGHTGDAPPPRLWWSVTGPLTLLPLHAAGRRDGPSVLDRVVSSYTPTLGALIRARVRPRSTAAPNLLVVAVSRLPREPELPELPSAAAEAALLSERFPGRATVRAEEDATVEEVLSLMPGHTCVHFSCHGEQDLTEPSAGALHMYDGPLGVGDIARLDLTDAELAYLSSCQTAVGGVDLLDEWVHPAAACGLAGYRHVIASLWTIADGASAEVADAIYAGLSDLCVDRAAYTVHEAVRRVRDAHPDLPLRWAPFLHIGP
jgi:tetratricopeptide (TPR) repeat protein